MSGKSENQLGLGRTKVNIRCEYSELSCTRESRGRGIDQLKGEVAVFGCNFLLLFL